jgi:hypothetical protein
MTKTGLGGGDAGMSLKACDPSAQVFLHSKIVSPCLLPSTS